MLAGTPDEETLAKITSDEVTLPGQCVGSPLILWAKNPTVEINNLYFVHVDNRQLITNILHVYFKY